MKKLINLVLLMLLYQLVQAGECPPAARQRITGAVADSCPANITIGKMSDFAFRTDKRTVIKTMSARIEGAMQLPSGYQAAITAQKEIHFLPGFSTAPGSTLHAWIDPAPCSSIAKATISTMDKTNSEAIIYPNPNSGSFMLSVPLPMALSSYDVRVTTIDGRLIEERKAQTGTLLTFNLQQAGKGMYIVHLQNSRAGLTNNFKVVIQ